MSSAEDADPPQLKNEKPKNEDEDGLPLSASLDAPAFTDPAILSAREILVKYRYTREELMKLREVPLSVKKPDIQNIDDIPTSIWWDVERAGDRKKSISPTENGPRQEPPDHRRRPNDPRERIRKENDGIVLSPQRRSFNSGCFVPLREQPRPNRPHSPLGPGPGKNDNPHMPVREIPAGTRRVGSGRIVRDNWDFGDKPENENDFNSFRGQPRNTDREERRSFSRDFDMGRGDLKDPKDRRNPRYNDRRRMYDKDEEPEWFSSGPISQHDTIELRGFDDADKPTSNKDKKKLPPSQAKRVREWAKKKAENHQNSISEEEESNVRKGGDGGPRDKTTPTPQDGGGKGSDNVAGEHSQDQSFLFEDIFKCDSISGLLTNGVGADGDPGTKSRFSHFFKRESPEQRNDSRRSSLQEEHILKHLLSDINEPAPPSVHIPGDTDSYFAPISPAANTGIHSAGPQNDMKSMNIMEMLHRGKQGQGDVNPNVKPGKMLSLDELESRMRKGADISGGKVPQQKQEDMVAFKRLMLSHSQQQDEARMQHQHHMPGPNVATGGGAGPVSPNPPPSLSSHDFTLKLQQAQQQRQQIDMLQKLMSGGLHPQQQQQQHLRASPMEMGPQQSRELLNRPEAQAILQAMHQRIPSPRELQVHTQNILQRALIKKKLEEQQENYRKKQEMIQQRGQSPAHNNNNQNKSVSSPTPLAFTPTSVLRKMTADKDEGKEMKMGDGKIPPGRAVTGIRMQQPPPQQMPPSAANWGSQFGVKQPGRPIVKANTNFQGGNLNGPEQFFAASQRMFNQQQQQQQNQPGRKISQSSANSGIGTGPPFPTSGNHSSFPNMNNTPPNHSSQPPPQQQFPQLTQQQLRARHQQMAQAPPTAGPPVPPPQTQQAPKYQHSSAAWQQFLNSASQQNRNDGMRMDSGDLSPTTSNQLARWFSRDLLDRARGGELPSTAGLAQHALSLEEIERQTAPPVHN